jgi:MFS family permease
MNNGKTWTIVATDEVYGRRRPSIASSISRGCRPSASWIRRAPRQGIKTATACAEKCGERANVESTSADVDAGCRPRWGISGSHIGLVLFVWGLSAATGVTTGGTLTDRPGYKRVIITSLSLLALAFVTMSASAYGLPPATARAPVLTAIVAWGLAAWSFFTAQQTRLISLAGVELASVALSLNASFMFGGLALGAVIGSVTIAHGSPDALGFVGAAGVGTSLLIVLLTTRSKKITPSALNLVASESPSRGTSGAPLKVNASDASAIQ